MTPHATQIGPACVNTGATAEEVLAPMQVQPNEKTCTRCGATKPLTEFGKNGRYIRSQCKPCRRQANREYARRHPQPETEWHPTALCECGCGLPVTIAKQTDCRAGYAKGEAVRFRKGHPRPGRPRDLSVPFEVDSTTGCWTWQRALNPDGYGQFQFTDNGKKRTVGAHRVFYEREFGSVPASLELDHLCRNRACVNPHHLEAVTHAENIRRGMAAKRWAAA